MKYIKLLRVKHYLKNILIFIPLIFSGQILNITLLTNAIIGFIVFSLIASTIYIINDIKDIEKDKKHPIKKNRPLASGQISIKKAITIIILLLLSVTIILSVTKLLLTIGTLVLLLYFMLNIIYSYGAKNIPLLDIIILASGFIIRVIYGGTIINIEVSNWLFLTILSISLYMALGKRRNELMKNNNKSRPVLNYYNKEFLDKNMYMFLTLSIIFYSLWSTMAVDTQYFKYTIIIVIIALMKYSMDIENDNYGDPVDVITKDKILLLIAIFYFSATIIILYI